MADSSACDPTFLYPAGMLNFGVVVSLFLATNSSTWHQMFRLLRKGHDEARLDPPTFQCMCACETLHD